MRINRGYSTYCSINCTNKSHERNLKIKNSCKLHGKETAEKIKNTCLKKYGVKNPMQVIQYQHKQNLSLKNTFTDPIKRKNIHEKYINTCLEKYGVKYPTQLPQFKTNLSNKLKNRQDLKDKQKQSLKQKYNVETVFQIPSVREKQIISKNDKAYEKILSWNNFVIPLFSRQEYSSRSKHKKYLWKCVKCNQTFYQQLGKTWMQFKNISQYIPRCPNCYPQLVHTSYLEQQLIDFCKQYFPNLITNNKKIIPPEELDIFIPQINLAIEFNGVYWHNIEKKCQNYHLNKTQQCEKLGIRLIHIWQDEWNNNKEQIKQKLIDIFNNNEIIDYSKPLDRCWYQIKNLSGYTIEILKPAIIIRNGFKVENCGYIKYNKIK